MNDRATVDSPQADVPVAKLGRLYAELDDGALSPPTREYLRTAIAAAVRRDEPLHVALGISRSGRYGSLQRQLLLEKRNDLLMEAFAAISLDDAELDYTRCKRLAKQIRVFVRREWPHARRRLDPDPEGPPGNALYSAPHKPVCRSI